MSNRVYLYCTDFPGMPAESQSEDFFKASGTEYEAKACVPLFWMCLFSSSDIKLLPADHNGFDDDSRPYAYLFCSKAAGIERLTRRSEMLKDALGPDRHALYLAWIERLKSEPFQNVLVKTEEIDWMGQEGELEGTLRKAYKHFEAARQQEGFQMSNAMNDIAGLWEDETLNTCESYELVGVANTAQQWPPRFSKQPERHPAPPKKSKWLFWK
ncbi:hypothetical protein [Herbaspirillum sp.]|uniref:hypothetical protein n=1 Tax=Herbaspirillum sp. TaxID=1890675 RepID=UPI0031D92F0F